MQAHQAATPKDKPEAWVVVALDARRLLAFTLENGRAVGPPRHVTRLADATVLRFRLAHALAAQVLNEDGIQRAKAVLVRHAACLADLDPG